jgi:hypothetical protein
VPAPSRPKWEERRAPPLAAIREAMGIADDFDRDGTPRMRE